MGRTTQLSKEKRQLITTIRQEDQSVHKILRTLKVSPSTAANAVMKLALIRITPGDEDQELPPLQRLNSLTLPATEMDT